MAGPSGIASYSTIPATNATTSGGLSNWAENQPPSSVNNSVRQDHADLRTAFNDLIWFSYGSGDQAPGVTFLGVPYVYVAANQVTVAGVDVTIPHHIGRRMKFVGALTGTVYGTISASVFGVNTTITLTMDGAAVLQNEPLTGYLSQIPITGSPVAAGSSFNMQGNVPIFFINSIGSGPTLIGQEANGTLAAPTATALSDFLLYLGGRGHGASAYGGADRAAIGYIAAENWTNAAQGTAIQFFTTPTGGVATTLAATLTNGGLGIVGPGGTPFGAAYSLDIRGSAGGLIAGSISNGSNAVGAQAAFFAQNDKGNQISLGTIGSGWSGLGPLVGGDTYVNATSTANVAINSTGGTIFFTHSGAFTETARLTATGLSIPALGQVGFNAGYPLDIQSNSNSMLRVNIANHGGGGTTAFVVANDTNLTQLTMYGTLTANSPPVSRTDGTLLYTNGTGGLTLCSAQNAPVYILSNGVEIANFGSGGFVLSNNMFVTAGAAIFLTGNPAAVDETNCTLLIGDRTGTTKQQLYMGVNQAGNYSFIGAVQSHVQYDWLLLNPSGGKVGVGSTGQSGTSRLNLEANAGNINLLSFIWTSGIEYVVFYNSSFELTIGATGVSSRQIKIGNAVFAPAGDGTMSCGAPGNRWGVVYSVTGTINTSGAEAKTNIAPLDVPLLAVAKDLSANIRTYKFIDAVADKGDRARLHVGSVWQDVAAAFTKHGLDPRAYGMICEDTMDDKTVHHGLRPDELTALIIAGLEARITQLERTIH